MGDKSAARRLADAAGMPIVPGTRGARRHRPAPRRRRRASGIPLLVKAAFGGGGKGMHVVRDADHLEESLKRAAREAQSYFGRPEVFLERYVDRAHHVEAQIMADTHGTVLFLGERDCSVQRRHQKLIEETPSPVVDDAIRERFARRRGRARARGRLRERRHDRMHPRRGRVLLLPGDEHAPAGGAHRHRDGDGPRPRGAADRGRARRAHRELEASRAGHAIQCRINAEDPRGTSCRARGGSRATRSRAARSSGWTPA